MRGASPKRLVLFVLATAFALPNARASSTITVKIPMGGKMSLVQRLNREGVEEVTKHRYDRAEALFLKAYLYDPADPFTLNNLGYISELQGQLERAHHFYELAMQQESDANIDMSDAKQLKGKPMTAALADLQDLPMRVNRMNVDAMYLLSHDQPFGAVGLLQQALQLDPGNPFTLNNLGVASEEVGDYDNALNYYRRAANLRSTAAVIITQDPSWSGKSVSDLATGSFERLEKRMQQAGSADLQSAMFSLRGVFEENQNNWQAARQDFVRAYSLDPASAFTLNNLGYVAERDGDLETAQFFYEKARRADDGGTPIGMATNASAQGQPIVRVAEDSDTKVDSRLEQYSRQRRGERGPVELTPRNNSAPPTAAPGSPK